MSAQTQSTQLKITIPVEQLRMLQKKSAHLGIKPATYVRHLVLTDLVEDSAMPVFEMTAEHEQFVASQIQEYKQGNTRRIDDIDDFIASV